MLKKYLMIPMVSLLIIILYALPILSVPVFAEVEKQNIWSLVIGISDYPFLENECNSDCTLERPFDMPYAVNNAIAFYESLCYYGMEEQSLLLLNENATKNDIYYGIKWLSEHANANDTVILYFSGLSLAPAALSEINIPFYTLDSKAGYLAPYESGSTLSVQVTDEIPYLYRKWYRDRNYDIAAAELSNWVDMITAPKVLIILDVNYAGSFGNGLSDFDRIIMMSSAEDEHSPVCAEFEHSSFTRYILEGFNDPYAVGFDNDYQLSAEELFSYARTMTTSDTMACDKLKLSINSRQHPVIADYYPGSFPLLYNCVFSTTVDLPAETILLTIDEQGYPIKDFPLSLTYTAGSVHQVTVPAQIDIGHGIRAIFTSWDDGLNDTSRTITAGGKYSPVYTIQYYASVASRYGVAQGEGWYDEGTIASLSVKPEQGFLIRRHFQRWSGDAAGNKPDIEITVNGPKTVATNWQTDYKALCILIACLIAIIVAFIIIYKYRTTFVRRS